MQFLHDDRVFLVYDWRMLSSKLVAHPRSAFTLVELSIALVIIGLLVGGVLAGQSLIRASELKSISSEHRLYMAAVSSFREKYDAMPGDMSNATLFWGNRGGSVCPRAPDPRAQPGTFDNLNGTCNGNGDGIVTAVPIVFPALPGLPGLPGFAADEQGMFWHHLSRAGLINGTFLPGSINGPLSKLSGGVWLINYIQKFQNAGCIQLPARYDIYGEEEFQVLAFMSTTPFNASCPGGLGVINALEAFDIDTKLDDGLADHGTVLVTNDVNTSTGCINNPASIDVAPFITSGSFQLADTTRTCRLFFKM